MENSLTNTAKNHIEALEYLDDDGLILDLHSWGTDPRREFTRLVERLSRWRRKNKNIQFVPRCVPSPTPDS